MIAEAFYGLGAIVYLIAGIGVLRLPDILQRMQAATKAGSGAAALVLIGFIVDVHDAAIGVRAAAAIVFLFLTLPVASYLLGRVAIVKHLPLASKRR